VVTNGRIATVLLTGTAGAGKSIVAKEIHELLRRVDRPNSFIDLDAIGRAYPPVDPPFNAAFILANLRAMWPNYRALGLDYLILARVLQSPAELDGYRELPGIDLRVVRLDVPPETIRTRLASREPGVSQSFLLRIAPRIAEELAVGQLDDFVVSNGPGDGVTEVAAAIMDRLGWPVPKL
jgi:chloramphenicol 3-O-phosphotransferase